MAINTENAGAYRRTHCLALYFLFFWALVFGPKDVHHRIANLASA
jgi:hypothetical protein